MNFSQFFISRPVFASVLSLLILFVGSVAMRQLPIQQYPEITPPQIQVQATYNGANAETMAYDVAAPLEQQINGCENMIYMYSQNSSTGSMVLDVFFKIGSNADIDQVNVQNLVSQALAQLPQEVQLAGVTINKQMPSILLIVAMQSNNNRYDQIFTSNYANINIVPDLQLLPGISNVNIIGARNYSMRIWMRPDLMAQLDITTSDIINAIQQQSNDYGIGQLGQAPNPNPVPLTIPLKSLGRLSTVEEFENIVLKADLNGAMVLIKDVATVELGAQDYSVDGEMQGIPTTLIAIYQEYGSNALQVAASIKETMARLSKTFPEDLTYSIPYDTTLYIQASINEVVRTLLEAAGLVVLVVLIFLQSFRMTLIPVIALVVSVIGTFAGLYLLNFSINTLTLFGMVLAIGIVVDDAIVVVENVERNMRQHQLKPMEAARKAMQEVTGPIIAIVFVLCAVFIPIAFLGGIAGQLYQQFAITISISVLFSGLVALSLSPSLAARLIKPQEHPNKAAVWFNRGFDKVTEGYLKVTGWVLKHSFFGVGCLILIFGVLFYLFKVTPTSLVPNEDQGYLIAFASLPDAASLDRTKNVDLAITDISKKHPGVQNVVSLTGFNLLTSLDQTTIGSNFLILDDWNKRKTPDLKAGGITHDLNKELYGVKDAQVFLLNPPAIQGLGTVGGFEFWIENRGNEGFSSLASTVEEFIEKAKSRPELTPLVSMLQIDNMQLAVNIDRYKAYALGVPISDILQTLQAYLGSVYVNNFNKYGRVFEVLVQAQPSYRSSLKDFGNIYMRSYHNQMVPLNSLVSLSFSTGSNLITRFNSFNAAKIMGGPAPGYSSGQALKAMEELALEVLPSGMTYAWSGEAYQEIEASSSMVFVLIASLIMVFLILSALYEKWSLPLAILLAIPFGMLGAFTAIWLAKMSNDVYFQIGLVTLIALSAKNAILIVEFAHMKRKEGATIIEAALLAAKLRFRAILMTSLTFIFGVLPLVTSSGAGAASRHSVGVGVMGGMIFATTLALFFVPCFYKIITSISERRSSKKEENGESL